MRVHVLLFAAARERAGRSELFLELAPGARAGEVREAAVRAHPGLASIASVLRVAVNQVFVADDATISDGDELALLPPVSGGRGAHLRIIAAPLSLDRVVEAVSDEEHGAVATFSGVVRRHSHGQRVHRLDYEAYVPMAERTLRELVGEIERNRPSVRIAVEHRVGELTVGDLAVVIAVGAPHRGEALRACQETIDALKERVPIWKREHTDAGADWVGCEGCAREREESVAR